MPLYFITGNKNKFKEIEEILPGLEFLEMDLPEIQEIDPHKVVRAKLEAAFAHKKGEFIVEDTSLYLECLNGLPGPLVKWFQKTIGIEGIANLAEKLGNDRAEAKTIIGYAKNSEEIHFFEGAVSGKIVSPRGGHKFGWDPIFQPGPPAGRQAGPPKTFAEMEDEERRSLKMRRVAALKLKDFLKQP